MGAATLLHQVQQEKMQVSRKKSENFANTTQLFVYFNKIIFSVHLIVKVFTAGQHSNSVIIYIKMLSISLYCNKILS